MEYLKMRTEADEDAATIDLAADGGAWKNRPSSDVLSVSDDVDYVSMIFAGGIDAGTDPDDTTFSWKLYAWKDQNCPAEYVAYGTGTIGTQDVVLFPDGKGSSGARQWADTIAITDDQWVGVVDVVDSGSNRVCKLKVQTRGYKYFYIEITDADGSTGTEAGSISIWATTWKEGRASIREL